MPLMEQGLFRHLVVKACHKPAQTFTVPRRLLISDYHRAVSTNSAGYKTIASSDTTGTQKTAEAAADIAHEVVRLLRSADETLGVAESLTGGGLMAALTSVPGPSAAFRGGVVSYATGLKGKLLRVETALVARAGVVHPDVASQMAEGARRTTTTDPREPTTWGIGATGVAGPDDQDGKPAGTVYVAVAGPEGTRSWGPFRFPGPRERVREATIREALSRLRQVLADKN